MSLLGTHRAFSQSASKMCCQFNRQLLPPKSITLMKPLPASALSSYRPHLRSEATLRQYTSIASPKRPHSACSTVQNIDSHQVSPFHGALRWMQWPALVFWSILIMVLFLTASPVFAFLFAIITLAPFIFLISTIITALLAFVGVKEVKSHHVVESGRE